MKSALALLLALVVAFGGLLGWTNAQLQQQGTDVTVSSTTLAGTRQLSPTSRSPATLSIKITSSGASPFRRTAQSRVRPSAPFLRLPISQRTTFPGEPILISSSSDIA